MLPSSADLAWIRRFRRSLARAHPRLAAIAEAELGRPPFETLMSDVVPLLDACKWHERRARRVLRSRRIRGGGLWRLGQRHKVRRLPLGHVAIIATWNYPYQLLGIQLVQAIAAGNRVTVKPSERSPGAHAALLEIARETGLGESRLSWTAPTREAGRDLLELGQFDHVVFTGATATGREIARTLAESLTSSTLELSGSDSAIVLGSADPRLAARSIAFAMTMNAGQSCMAPRRVIVESGIYDAFTRELRPLLASASARRLSDDEARRCRSLIEQARAEGAEVASGPDSTEGFAPVALLACPPASAINAGEHFAPAIAVVRSESRQRTLALAHAASKSLATAIYTRSPREADNLANALGAGFVTLNDCLIPTAHPGASIGGRGLSGWGLTRGEFGLLAMTRPQFVSRTSLRLRVPTDPPTPAVQRKIERFVHFWYTR